MIQHTLEMKGSDRVELEQVIREVVDEYLSPLRYSANQLASKYYATDEGVTSEIDEALDCLSGDVHCGVFVDRLIDAMGSRGWALLTPLQSKQRAPVVRRLSE